MFHIPTLSNAMYIAVHDLGYTWITSNKYISFKDVLALNKVQIMCFDKPERCNVQPCPLGCSVIYLMESIVHHPYCLSIYKDKIKHQEDDM